MNPKTRAYQLNTKADDSADVQELSEKLRDERKLNSDLQSRVNHLETKWFKALARIAELER